MLTIDPLYYELGTPTVPIWGIKYIMIYELKELFNSCSRFTSYIFNILLN